MSFNILVYLLSLTTISQLFFSYGASAQINIIHSATECEAYRSSLVHNPLQICTTVVFGTLQTCHAWNPVLSVCTDSSFPTTPGNLCSYIRYKGSTTFNSEECFCPHLPTTVCDIDPINPNPTPIPTPTPTPTPTPPSRSDLIVSEPQFTQNGATVDSEGLLNLLPGVPIQVTVPISIIRGSIPEASAVSVNLWHGSESASKTIRVNDIPDAGTQKVFFTINLQGGEETIVTISAGVNADLRIPETDYTNNYVSVRVRVQSSYVLILSSDNVELPSGSTLSIAPSIVPAPGCGLKEFKSSKSFSIKCVNKNTNAPVDGCKYSVTPELGFYSGGHDHNTANRPLGNISPPANLDTPISSQGTAFNYIASDISQEVKLSITGKDPFGGSLNSLSTLIQIRVLESEAWATLSNEYIDVVENGADPFASHIAGHFGTFEMAKRVRDMGRYFNEALGNREVAPKLKSEAGSLPWGGLYDWHKDWKKPHCGHRDGKTIDLSVKTLTSRQKAFLQKAVKDARLGFYYIPESPSSSNPNIHWHAEMLR